MVRKLLIGSLVLAGLFLALATAAPAEAKKPRAYIFFSQYCLACKEKAPLVRRWAKRNLKGYRVRGIGYQETTPEARRFARKIGFRFPVKGDPNGRRAKRLRVSSPTAILLVSKSGKRRLLDYENW